jgi:glycosyltransferase involved in cell wall biosynthesis
MNLPTVAVCIVTRNDLPFLKLCVEAAKEYADEFVIIDNESDDGTYEWLEEQKTAGLPLKFKKMPKDTVPEMGYSFLKNMAASMADSEWIHSIDSDEMLSAEQRPALKHYLRMCKSSVVSINTFTFQNNGGWTRDVHLDWDFIANNCKWDSMTHRRIYRNKSGIMWKGYIHEELYNGELNAAHICWPSDFKHLHFSNFRTWGNDDVKRARYAWMLMNAFRRPALQMYTNSWWYEAYVPDMRETLEKHAAEYEQMKAEGKY